jgi:hypothetical protein
MNSNNTIQVLNLQSVEQLLRINRFGIRERDEEIDNSLPLYQGRRRRERSCSEKRGMDPLALGGEVAKWRWIGEKTGKYGDWSGEEEMWV